MSKTKIIIVVSGGVVTDILSEENNIKVEVLDSDCMSSSEFERRLEKAREECKFEVY